MIKIRSKLTGQAFQIKKFDHETIEKIRGLGKVTVFYENTSYVDGIPKKRGFVVEIDGVDLRIKEGGWIVKNKKGNFFFYEDDKFHAAYEIINA